MMMMMMMMVTSIVFFVNGDFMKLFFCFDWMNGVEA